MGTEDSCSVAHPPPCNMSRFTLLLVLAAVAVCVSANGLGHGRPPSFTCHENGFFADYHRNCVVFYECDGGSKTTFACPEGLRFDDQHIHACLPDSKVPCPYPSR